jgi:hypothetical protein
MKRFFLLALIGIALVAIAVLGFSIVRGNADKEAIAQRIRRLPEFQFSTLDGAAFTPAEVSPEKSLVIIHFLPDCHYCQGEATELAAHAELFSSAHILMVSAADARSLRAFGRTFGTVNVPTTFVYSPEQNGQRRLLKQFTGETSAKAIHTVLSTFLTEAVKTPSSQ